MLRCFFATLPGANSDDIARDFASGRGHGHSFPFVLGMDELMLSYFKDDEISKSTMLQTSTSHPH